MAESLSIWNAADPEGYRLWTDAWQRWPQREVFAHPGYVSLYAKPGTEAVCAAWNSAEGSILFPLLVRKLASEGLATSDVCDLTTPYGYGGPFFWNAADPASLAARFWEAYGSWVARISAVSEFIRFSLQADRLLPYPGERRQAAENIVCDLTLNEDALWSSFEQKVRKNVKKARRSGVTVSVDPSGDRIEDFLKIYYGTMERRGAGTGYFFPKEYFRRLTASLPGQAAYFHAMREGKIISSELVLVSSDAIYSFLGGTEESSFELRPNDMLKFEIMRWGKDQGRSKFVLGGGYEAGDGIFRYKKSFSPSGSLPFFTGRRILLPELYAELVAGRKAVVERTGGIWAAKPGYFPAYRA